MPCCNLGARLAAVLQIVAAPLEGGTVEQFVQAEIEQLEQRIRVRDGGGGGAVACAPAVGCCRPLSTGGSQGPPPAARFCNCLGPHAPSPVLQAKAEQIANQLRQEWKEARAQLLMA